VFACASISDRFGVPPIIRVDFKNTTIVEGSRLLLNCEFKSDQEPLMQTYFYKTDVNTSEDEFVQMQDAKEIKEVEVG
jgi:hypothetical protein